MSGKFQEIEKIEACRKLDFIRRKLMDLESSAAEANYDCDTGFSSNSENDKDFKIVESLRNRLRKLNETSFELKKRVQKLELENNGKQPITNIKTKPNF